MKTWSDKVWHHAVRQRLGERLVFYRARLQAGSLERATRDLNAMLEAEKLSSVNGFLLFGAYDLLVRAWLHPNVISSFRYKLAETLQAESTPLFFVVNDIVTRWYANQALESPKGHSLLNTVLDTRAIQQIQRDQNPQMLGELIQAGLILNRFEAESDSIPFFVAISLAQPHPFLEAASKVLVDRLRSSKNIQRPSLYMGDGFCNILVEARVDPAQYFAIGRFLEQAGSELLPFAPSFETYLATGPRPALATAGTISLRTFIELRGRDPFVASIIPEAYSALSTQSDSVISALQGARSQALSAQDRRLLHDYLIGYLENDPSKSAVSLLLFFTELEGYLRGTYKAFLKSRGLDEREARKACGVESIAGPMPYPTLGDLLCIVSRAIDLPDAEKPSTFSRWEEFVGLRNQVAHGMFDLEDWSRHLSILTTILGPLRRLLGIISAATRIPPHFSPPIQIFISYTPDTRQVAEGLAEHLRPRHVVPLIDVAKKAPDEDWRRAIDEAMAKVDGYILIVGSGGARSASQETEWRSALRVESDFQMPIVPVLVDGVDLPGFLRDWNSIRVTSSALDYDDLADKALMALYNPDDSRDLGGRELARAEQQHRLDELKRYATSLKSREGTPSETP